MEKSREHSALKIETKVVISVLTSDAKELKFNNYHKYRKKKYCFLCRSQSNSLLIIFGFYVIIFSVASVILIMSFLKQTNQSENEKFAFNVKTSTHFLKDKYNTIIKQLDNQFSKTLFKEFSWPYRSTDFNCSSLSNGTKFKYITSGWTKNVFSFEQNGNSYALKTVNADGVDMKNCLRNQSREVCFEKVSSKIYKEYILSKELSHSNIIKVLAWCVSNNQYSNDIAIVTELCSPLDIVSLLRMTFYQRLKIMLDLSQLMVYLTESSLGSVAINDFQRQQFVICGETLKLTDLDDLSIDEPKCNKTVPCIQGKLSQLLEENQSSDSSINCVDNFCLGYNEKLNVINTYKHFVTLFLNISTPIELKDDIETFFNSYTSTWNARTVLQKTKLLSEKYKNFLKLKIGVFNMSVT